MLATVLSVILLAAEPEAAGERPYELEWAGRIEESNKPLVDFEDLSGWKVDCVDSEARFERTREQQIWGKHVGKLTYRGTGPGPQVRILPPAPVPIAQPFDAVTIWMYGNNWGWAPDASTPQVGVHVVLEDSAGNDFSVFLYNVDWTEWNLLHRRLSPPEIERVKGGAKLEAILITGGRNKEDRALFFDNLAVFVEKFPPLEFEPRPERGVSMFPGQSAGANTGPGKLPFPTRPETILPENVEKEYTTSLRAEGEAHVFTYEGHDGKLSYRLEPRTGTLGDITASWEGRGGLFQPCAGGGAYLDAGGRARLPDEAKHVGTEAKGETVVSRWQVRAGNLESEVTYTYRLWAKSLVVDVAAPGGKVAEVRYGRAVGLEKPRLVTNPFYLYSWGGARPAVVVSGPPEAPLFLAGNTDWCLSSASVLWATNAVEAQGVTYNGGTRYIARTDGRRNDCHERLFITVSLRYEEVLPTIPNPVSPWKHVTGTRVWRAHGAGNRESDAAFWRECHRYGMTRVNITDHETGWRDGGESFTFRTKPAPKKGGDKGQYDYARLLQDDLGFVYGPYNNFTDFAPVNEYWSLDMVSRTPENQLQHAWMRCYAPKPARAVEYCARLAPEIQKKFHFSTAYCDVHTAVAPWDRTDYDARVPGAGTFAAVFYSFGEIMLHQKKAWSGPVYSEGSYHFMYCGLTDGNYGQDNPYRPWKNPWLVDFDLRKLHDLCCNFGMGNPGMFYGNDFHLGGSRAEMDAVIDRFLAATVAFGHPGFLTYEGGLHNALRSYYMLVELHGRYCLASAEEIRYADQAGRLLDTSSAVASGAYARSQVVTRYTDGTVTAVNGHPRERMAVEAHGRKLDLPPNGYAGWTADGLVDVLSSDAYGHRADYAVTPSHVYVDGRGIFTRFEEAASSGIGICRKLPGGKHEVIPLEGAECGFKVRAATARALDKAGKEIGPAELRTSRGLAYVLPVQGAFSYMLEPPPPSTASTAPALSCPRDRVVPGERVVVRGKEDHVVEIPADAREGDRVWREIEGSWVDFTVVPLAKAALSLEGNALAVVLTSHLASAEDFEIGAAGRKAGLRLGPGIPGKAIIDLGPPEREGADKLRLEISAGRLEQRIERGLKVSLGHARVADLPEKWRAGLCLRGGKEDSDFGATGGNAYPSRTACGGAAKDSIAMHPPYMGGVGYSFVLFEPVTLPVKPKAAFRAEIGKGDGSDPGDGILYKLAVVAEDGAQTVLAERHVARHEWAPLEADLSPWAGKTVQVKLIADVGAADDSTGDWACWAGMRIEAQEASLLRQLE